MTLIEQIKAMPTIADANSDLCVSRAAVLALLEAKAEEWQGKPGVSERQVWTYRQCGAELAGERPAAGS